MPNSLQENASRVSGDLPLKKPEPLRVLAVIPGPGTGASMIFARRQVESLAGPATDIRTFYLSSRLYLTGLAQEWCRLRREVDNFRPHLVHAHYGTVTAFLCAIATTSPLVITFRGSDLNFHPEVGFWRSRAGYLLSQVAASRAAAIICVSRQLRSRLWFLRERTQVIPDGVNLDQFRPLAKAEARKRLGWSQEVRVIVFNTSGRPRAKGIELVKAAIQVAAGRVGHIQMAILDGTVAPSDVPLLLSASDCVAVASLNEGSPNIVKEALACNLPVVSVDVGDVSERLIGVHPSRMVPRDAEEFGNAFADILTSGLRSNGREIVVDCDEESVARRILDIYERFRPERKEPEFIRTDALPSRSSASE